MPQQRLSTSPSTWPKPLLVPAPEQDDRCTESCLNCYAEAAAGGGAGRARARLQRDGDGHGLPPLRARHGVAVLSRGVRAQLVLGREHHALAVGRAAHPVLVAVVVCARRRPSRVDPPHCVLC